MAVIESKVINRWIIVIGAIMIQLALGAIYAWSAFTTPLQGTDIAISEFAFNKTQAQAIFSAGLATFAIFTIIGGRLSKKYGPRKIALLGGIFLGLGYILSSFVERIVLLFVLAWITTYCFKMLKNEIVSDIRLIKKELKI